MLVYPSRMRRAYLFLILAAQSACTAAQVYRWVDSDGRTHYSDRPAPDAEALRIDGTERPNAPDPSAQPLSGTPLLGPYASFEIVSPEPNQTLRQEPADLPVSLLLDPPLISGHRLELVLDGTPIPVDQPVGTQVSLKGLAYGSHVAEAQIRNSAGAVIARTASVSFHLRKPLPPGVLQ
jgi:hypothetical protein